MTGAAMGGRLVALTVVAAVGSGVVGGVLFAFSSFVMPALRRLPPAQGLAAMQAINVTAVTPAFMTVLFGTAAVCVVLATIAVRQWGAPFAMPLLVGAVAYLIGVIVVTVVFHVPRNDALAAVDPAAPAAAARWATYQRTWTASNHVRAGAAIVAATAFVWALVVG